MFLLILFLASLFVAVAFGVMAAMSDYKGMTIPNMNSVVIFCVFVVCFGALSLFGAADVFSPVLSHLLGFVLVFLGGFAFYALKVWGAGDQKLMAAFAIWMGFSGVPAFLVYTSIFGGVLGLVALYLKKYKPVREPLKDSWIDQVQSGAGKVPYGIAITLGALASFAKIGYFSIDTFRIFL